MSRRSVFVKGLDHGTGQFPIATRSGPLVVSSAIHGKDPSTGKMPDDLQGQIVGVFLNIRRVIEAAGSTPADIVKVVVFAQDPAATRPLLESPWTELFPNESDRPVRHTVGGDLPPPLLVQAEFVAYVEDLDK
jgi:2-iminobutanoate/2-iminopropanoate deaminase